jgi:Family of unknown function (DUF6228)
VGDTLAPGQQLREEGRNNGQRSTSELIVWMTDMNAGPPECVRCRAYKSEVVLLRAEIASLRQSALALTTQPVDAVSVLKIIGMHEPERLEIAGPLRPDLDFYRVSLTYRDQLSARCVIPIADAAAFLRFFEDLAEHKKGWVGEKKVASLEGQFAITCTYEGKSYRPEVSMDVYCALDYPSFDPNWTVQLHMDVDPDSLEDVAVQARAAFASTAAEQSDADRKPPSQR